MSSFFWEARKRIVGSLAEEISSYYFPLQSVDPALIANDEGITFSYGNYQNSFDGLLQHQYGNFHIYINLDRLQFENAPRTRFTFAHELAHYYIDDHRNALKNGLVPSHPSFNALFSKNPVEIEADYFAACLLMPSKSFQSRCLKKPLCSDLIAELAKYFNTSISSVIFRYFELNMFPMAIVCSKNGRIEWVRPTRDFKYKKFYDKGDAVPNSTAAGEFFFQNRKYETTEIVYPDDWFLDEEMDTSEQLYEKCYYQSNNTVFSLIWKKEK
ncbi:ImmA/IrrE family metallo-endopeptidase [Dyadobacter sp. 22481]|jgi:Zn-dependent peptidase ImmA (M78 family)|uniref:ImmA/IrrE family metallo-endopeptidase n=1 Tax=Dyadobacter sp. 22481 TaxID=3453926 RepID=UPI003F8764FD